MLNLPSKFRKALGNGTRTSLYPLIRIYKGYEIDDTIPDNAQAINLSIKETSIKHVDISGESYQYYAPLLLQSPSINSKADIINNKYTISSVSLSISNAPYNGRIFSDDIPSYLNAVVRVYYAANGLDNIDDCLLVYTGTIRRYTQSAETVKLTLEDLTEQKLSTKIPATLIEEDGLHADRYIGKPYPMVYGYVDKSPLVYNNENLLEIDKPNKDIGGDWIGESLMNFGNPDLTEHHTLVSSGHLKQNAYLSVYDNGFVPIYAEGTKEWGSRVHENLENATLYSYQDANSESSANIKLYPENFIYEGEQYDSNLDAYVKVGKQGIPARVYRPIKKVLFAAKNDFSLDPESENRYIGYTDDDGSMSLIAENVNNSGNNRGDEYGAQSLYDDFWLNGTPQEPLKFWEPTDVNNAYLSSNNEEIVEFVDRRWQEFYNGSYSSAYFNVQWIQNENPNSGLHISAQNKGVSSTTEPRTGSFARLELSQNVGDLPCVTKIFYDIDYFGIGNGLNANQQHIPVKFWVERELVTEFFVGSINSTQGLLDSNYYHWLQYDDDGIISTNSALVPNDTHSFRMVNLAADVGLDDYNGWGHITNDGGLLNNNGYNNVIKNFDTTNATDTINWGMCQFGGGYQTNSVIANLREVYIIQDALIIDYNNRNFHADVAGRLEGGQVITSANKIMQNILSEELTYGTVIQEQETNIQNDWLYSFTLNEQKEAKQIFEGIAKSSLLIPTFNSMGQFKFIGIKQIITDYSDVQFIKTEDVVKYSFSLTKLDDVYNSVNVLYKKNYGSNEYDEQTGFNIGETQYTTYDELTQDGLGYDQNSAYNISTYGLKSEDAKLEFTSDYIRDRATAMKLQKKLLMWHCNQHLITKIDLPPHYMHLEVGDYIKFNELLGNKKAFGYDYSNTERRNGQFIYDIFFITSISKSLTQITVEAIQVHRGEFGLPSTAEEDTGDIINGNGNDVTENYQLPDPLDDPNYSDDTINNYEWIPEEDYLNLNMANNNILNDGIVTGVVTTNMEDPTFKVWVKTVNSDIDLGNNGTIDYYEGSFETGDLSADELLNLNVTQLPQNQNLKTYNLTIAKEYEFVPEDVIVEYELEVKNSEFEHTFDFYQFGISEVIGDVTGDNIVNVLDIVTTVNMILGYQEADFDLADINEDGRLNVQDVIMLVNIIIGN